MNRVRPAQTCPICGRATRPAHRPFCSPRCVEVDLGRWLTGQYVIPGPPGEMDDEAPPASEPA
ncbi:MAG: DNA gyrase inhibitor YacG [Acetobacteraceae bacterium]